LPQCSNRKTAQNFFEEAGIWEDKWWIGGYELEIAFAPELVSNGE
jgi:hypothetical protein